MTITDKQLVQACEIYMQISDWTREEFIADLKQLSEQVAPMRFDDILEENNNVVNNG